MSSINPQDFRVNTDELHNVGAKARTKPDILERDPLARFLQVPNHAFFLFTSEDETLDAYIRRHWAALDGLSGDICDIHVSLTQLQGREDAYTQLSDIRSIRGLTTISLSMLPALHVWSAHADLTFSLSAVDGNFDQLRNALRNIFGSMHSFGGPITDIWVAKMRAWNASLSEEKINGHAQTISGNAAGRDIIQITNLFTSAYNSGDFTMSTSKPNQTDAPKSQTIEDVVTGRAVSQSSGNEADSQAIRRAQAVGDISQTKRKAAEMKFMGGAAAGWGIVGLVVVILAWIAYKYFSMRS